MTQPPNDAKPTAALAAVSRLSTRSAELGGSVTPQSSATPQGPAAASTPAAPTTAGPATGPAQPAVHSAEVELSSLPKIIRFDALARCGDEIWIENEGQIYRLRKTRQGKLILTK